MTLYIDPAYKAYYQNKLFDESDPHLNRDGSLLPYIHLKKHLELLNIPVQTFDLYRAGDTTDIYWSMGVLQNYEELSKTKNLVLDSFFIFEPPLVAPQLYKQLPLLTKYFKKVYVHNTNGDGYSLAGVDLSKLKKLYWPQPCAGVIEKHWSQTNRKKAVVMISGLHRPRGFSKTELYSARIQKLVGLEKHIPFDLYGRGWGKLLTRNALSWAYLLNYRTIMKNYHGSVVSKYETYAQYDFSLCFENLLMSGYITEKIFDCFYAGVIPIYKGATDIQNYIPKNCYIHSDDFQTADELAKFLNKMTKTDKQSYRDNARDFLSSTQGQTYFNSLIIESKSLI